MNKIIEFLFKWIIPIGFVQIIVSKKDKLLTKDNFGKQTYWRLGNNKKLTGANILIRRT